MLDKSKYRDIRGYKYMLTESMEFSTGIIPPVPVYSEYICLNLDGVMEMSRGYAWDGPSGPTIDTDDFMRGALVHDGFYQLLRRGMLPKHYRKQVDKLLRQMCREDGMPWWRRAYVYLGVQKFGGLVNAWTKLTGGTT